MEQKYKVALIIPTYNAGCGFERLLAEIAAQTLQPGYRLVIDSASTDGTEEIAKKYGWQVNSILRKDFSHGGTRQQAVEMLSADIDIAVLLTQDVRMPDRDSLKKLLRGFANPDVAAVYGRQLPHLGASLYAAVDREFNYPPVSRLKSLKDKDELGIKTAFLSDSFAAYRLDELRRIGGFPAIDICEDMYVAGKLLLSGKKIAYMAEAEAEHSHEPDLREMWHRYRKMGAFQRENPWLQESFGSAGGEGMKLLQYQLKRIGKEKGIAGIAKIILLDMVRFISFKLP